MDAPATDLELQLAADITAALAERDEWKEAAGAEAHLADEAHQSLAAALAVEESLKAMLASATIARDAALAREQALKDALTKIANDVRVPRPPGPLPLWCSERSPFATMLDKGEIARAALASATEPAQDVTITVTSDAGGWCDTHGGYRGARCGGREYDGRPC